MNSKIWTAVVNMRPSRNILVVDSLYDESGVVCYTYGDMGEVTQETRIYALPFLTNPLALSTHFTYDSWGRIQEFCSGLHNFPRGSALLGRIKFLKQPKSKRGMMSGG